MGALAEEGRGCDTEPTLLRATWALGQGFSLGASGRPGHQLCPQTLAGAELSAKTGC